MQTYRSQDVYLRLVTVLLGRYHPLHRECDINRAFRRSSPRSVYGLRNVQGDHTCRRLHTVHPDMTLTNVAEEMVEFQSGVRGMVSSPRIYAALLPR